MSTADDQARELAARGALGTRLRHLVDSGVIQVHPSFVITGFTTDDDGLTVRATTPAGEQQLTVDLLVPAAVEGVLTEENAGDVTARIVVEGANGPTTSAADRILLGTP